MQEPPGLNPKWFEKKVDYSLRNKNITSESKVQKHFH